MNNRDKGSKIACYDQTFQMKLGLPIIQNINFCIFNKKLIQKIKIYSKWKIFEIFLISQILNHRLPGDYKQRFRKRGK